jgi:hypothetical protein
LSGIHDWIVREGRVCDDKVLLSCLEGLDEGKVRVIENFVRGELAVSNEATFSFVKVLAEELVGFGSAKVTANRGAQLIVLILEKGDRLLKGFE